MSIIRLPPGTSYVNVDALPGNADAHLVSLTSRQLHIVRSFVFPYARFPHKLLTHLGGQLYEDADADDITDYVDDLDAIEDAIGGVPMSLVWADADDLQNVSTSELAGITDTVARGDHVHGINTDAAVVTGLSDDALERILTVGEYGDLSFDRSPTCYGQAHLTASIAAGGTVVAIFTNVYATGLLLVGCSVSTIAGAFICARGSCTAIGTPALNLTNVKDTASKVNIYHDSDNYVKAQNNYSTAVQLRLLFLTATSAGRLDITI